MGKSALIRRLCLDWATDCIPHFDFVFLLDGKALAFKQPTFSLQTLLLNFSTFAPPCLDPDAVCAQMAAAPERVLVAFDGFNELRDYETLLQPQEKDLLTSMQRSVKAPTFTVKQLYSAILQRVLLPGCTLLLSARARGTATQLLRRTDRFFEVCGFSPANTETYVTQYFADPALRASALERLEKSEFLRLLCWNPGLCRLVCLFLELSKNVDVLPRTLTELCNQLLHLKMNKSTECARPNGAEPRTEATSQSGGSRAGTAGISEKRRSGRNAETTWVNTQRARRGRKQQGNGVEVIGETRGRVFHEAERLEERALLSQLGHLAWEAVKVNSSVLNAEQSAPPKLRAFGLGLGLIVSRDLRTRHAPSGRGFHAEQEEMGHNGEEWEGGRGSPCDHILLWSSPFLQSYLAALHLCLSRFVSSPLSQVLSLANRPHTIFNHVFFFLLGRFQIEPFFRTSRSYQAPRVAAALSGRPWSSPSVSPSGSSSAPGRSSRCFTRTPVPLLQICY